MAHQSVLDEAPLGVPNRQVVAHTAPPRCVGSLARWDGCTHQLCDCGAEMDRGYTICSACRDKKRLEQYEAMPFKEWDGIAPLTLHDDDEYFWDILPEDQYVADIYPELADAFENLNKLIREHAKPISWTGGKCRTAVRAKQKAA